ncbi:MAG TPA: flagellar basal body rod C-terminal domain-containing protein [Candidatus Acidoferrales bacterium]|jgi:flagellar basal body rod protein FlgC|nr:flagellar basal body rod C-terminal domain-containing protein [Candidatus Acidoferrales bacterium]
MSLDLLDSAASGMDAQRAALDVAARNVAAAEAAGPNAEYARAIPDFSVVEDEDGEALVRFEGTHQERGTNVDILTEMIAVMNASRAYESNASLFDTGKQLAEKTIELGRL